MKASLIDHIRKHIVLDDAAAEVVGKYFQTLKLKKKEYLLQEGQICRSLYFVDKGCLRMFFAKTKIVSWSVLNLFASFAGETRFTHVMLVIKFFLPKTSSIKTFR